MVAGTSAHDEAVRAQERAARLAEQATVAARQARAAARRAENFARGAQGERRVADTLAPLSSHGFHVLHDRRCPGAGGNVDHVVVGPPGVFVLDAKAWSGPIRVEGARLVAQGADRSEALVRARAMRDEVGGALVAGGVAAPVYTGLVFVDGDLAGGADAGGVAVLPIGHVVPALTSLPVALSTLQVEQTLRLLSQSFPPADAPAPIPSHSELAAGRDVPSEERLLEVYRRFYVTEWRGRGMTRLYVRDGAGRQVGFRDDRGAKHLEDGLTGDDAVMARAILARVSRGGKDADAPPLPKYRVGGFLTGRTVDFLVGTRWRRGDAERLYVFLVGPSTPRMELGHVDMVSGRVHVDGGDVIPGRASTKAVLLGFTARLAQASSD